MDRKVFLKIFEGVPTGSFEGSRPFDDKTVETDADGKFKLTVPAEAFGEGIRFGVGYDPTLEDLKYLGADTNPDEIQRFTSPALDLTKEPSRTADVTFDVGLAVASFSPPHFADITSSPVTFTLPVRPGTKTYETIVTKGGLAVGAQVHAEKNAEPKASWTPTENAIYGYRVKYTSDMGQAESPVVTLWVKGLEF